MTKAEVDEMTMCIGRGIVENRPPEPHRTIEDIFDTVSAIQVAKGMCYTEALKTWRAKTPKSQDN
jgi:hypothetical protein